MWYEKQFRDSGNLTTLLQAIRQIATFPIRIMEVCGGQTYALSRYRIEELLPDTVQMIHGPGCPVCVTHEDTISQAIEIARNPQTIFCTFGDMVRVPGTKGSLQQLKAEGKDIRIVYSPLDTLRIASENPEKQVVFFAIGFETTTPLYTLLLQEIVSRKITNLSLLTSLFTIPAAISFLAQDPECKIDGLLAAGHVCSITGLREYDALAEKLNCQVVPADATSVEDLENVFKRSMEILGGKIDFVLHSIGMSPNVRKKRTYDDLDYDMLSKTLDISAVSFHKMIQAAKKLDAIAEYGSILALSYVAAQRTFYGYNDMADAKALLESIARSFGYIYGREHNVRVNTISQSPTMTTAGSGVKGMDKLFDFANRMSPLGNASADECADYCIVMFSDLTRKVTMQNLFHDGGFSSVGMSLRAMATYEKGLDEYKDENGNIIYG